MTEPDAVTAAGRDGFPDQAVAEIEFIGRMGAQTFAFRWIEAHPDDGPNVYIAQARFAGDQDRHRYAVAAGLSAPEALGRLTEQLADGGQCTHCQRPTGYDPDPTASWFAGGPVCWYQYDPELKTIRRGCEGDK